MKTTKGCIRVNFCDVGLVVEYESDDEELCIYNAAAQAFGGGEVSIYGIFDQSAALMLELKEVVQIALDKERESSLADLRG